MQNIFAGNFRCHIIPVEAVRVLVDVGSIWWVEAEPIGMRPRGTAQLSKIDGRLRRESRIGQVVSRAK